MPINNSYSQTPKRIFTNKPFIKGMNYTNADLEPYVCRAVANLELESSNSATKLRAGILNNSIGSEGSIAYKFYNKYVIFKATMNEFDYTHNLFFKEFSSPTIEVIDDDTSFTFYENIITSSTDLSWDGSNLAISGDTDTLKFDNCIVVALCMNEGDIPHCVNGEDYSFSFVGAIYSNDVTHVLQYKGLLKIYYHVAANKMILEKIKPINRDYIDVQNYGVNLIASNPAIYKDWVTMPEHDYYADYFGDIANANTNKPIDIETVAMYDAEVPFSAYNNTSSAKMLKSVNGNSNETFYIRPYYIIPNSKYSAIVTAHDSHGVEYAYNFSSHKFELNPIAEDTKTSNNSISFNDISLTNGSTYNSLRTIEDTESETFTFAYSGTNLVVLFEPYQLTNTEVNTKYPSANAPVFDGNYDAILPYTYTVYELSKCTLDGQSETNYSRTQLQSTQEITNISETKWTKVVETCNLQSTLYVSKTPRIIIDVIKLTRAQEPDTGYSSVEIIYHYPNEVSAVFGVSPRTTIENYQSTINYDGFSISLESYNSGTEGGVWESVFDGSAYASYDSALSYHNRNGNSYTVSYKKQNDNTNYIYATAYLSPSNVQDYVWSYTTFLNSLVNHVKDNNGIGEPIAIHIYDSNGQYEDMVSGYLDPSEYRLFNSNPSVSIGLYKTINHKSVIYGTSTTVSNTDKILSPRLSYSLAANNNINIRLDITKRINKSIISAAYSHTVTNDSNISVDKNTAYSTFENMSVNNIISLFSNSGVSHPGATATVSGTFSFKFSYMPANICHVILDPDNLISNPSIPIKSSAATSIDTSTVEVKIFKPDTFTIDGTSYIMYYGNQFKKANLYTFGTSKKDYVDYSEIINNNLFSKPIRMCNHIGHTVVWGDYTNSKSLYYSEYGNPSYFPSGWVITLDNPIVYAYPHKGNLIVFTTEDIYMLYNGNVPAPAAKTPNGSEVAFTQKLIQANTRIGKEHINTVRSIGKDVFFINNNNNGYLLKANKYVNDESDVYLVKLTSQIDDLLDNPYPYALERFDKWIPTHSLIKNEIQMKVIPIFESSIDTDLYTITIDKDNITEYIDGDTIDVEVNGTTTRYRLADLDAPEITNGKNERLGNLAKLVLEYVLKNSSDDIYIYDTRATDKYDRHIAYISCSYTKENTEVYVNANATLLYNGLAAFFNENHDTGNMSRNILNKKSYSCALTNNKGIFNNINYTDNFTFSIDNSISSPVYLSSGTCDYNNCDLYVYATNSYIYVFQPIQLDFGNAITILYKYNIDSKVWITYDILGYINPSDIVTTSNKLGFKIVTNNLAHFTKPSIVEFTEQKSDVSNVGYTVNENNNYSVTYNNAVSTHIINAYFDSGNQSISLMNDKLFREIKLMLGSLPDDLLTLDYSIDLYVDGKLVIPNQLGDCGDHIHHRPINTHYKGRTENLEGFQKVTFFAPARGRIPRIVFSINCESDINVLEYAIVYMQLNAK